MTHSNGNMTETIRRRMKADYDANNLPSTIFAGLLDWIITGSEQEVARKLGRLEPNKQTRKDHKGIYSPTSRIDATLDDLGIIVIGSKK